VQDDSKSPERDAWDLLNSCVLSGRCDEGTCRYGSAERLRAPRLLRLLMYPGIASHTGTY
jgi:hypothetical protein